MAKFVRRMPDTEYLRSQGPHLCSDASIYLIFPETHDQAVPRLRIRPIPATIAAPLDAGRTGRGLEQRHQQRNVAHC